MILTKPQTFDGHLLARHISNVIGVPVFKRLRLDYDGQLVINIDGMTQEQQNNVSPAVTSYIHPTDVGQERSIKDILMGV